MVVLLVVVVCSPFAARAQSPISLASVRVQFWPEYDQPSMLVIYDFTPAEGNDLPVGVTIRFPKDANLIAVAVHAADGSLLNTEYQEATEGDTWQAVTVQSQSPTTYRVEYYQPLTRSENAREFSYTWPGDYDVGDFSVSLRLPVDATGITTSPELQPGEGPDGSTYLENHFGLLPAGRPLTLELGYIRASDELAVSPQDLQPSVPLDASTSGRVMLSNYLPYVLGILGLVLAAGGGIYFWQSSRGSPTREKRHRGGSQRGSAPDSDEYCPQCGTRAQPSDRFCRVCGSRLRQGG
jgi:hypothetical protein